MCLPIKFLAELRCESCGDMSLVERTKVLTAYNDVFIGTEYTWKECNGCFAERAVWRWIEHLGVVIGFVTTGRTSKGLFFYNLGVVNEYRRLGVGSALMRLVLSHHGVVYGRCSDRNLYEFYQRLGATVDPDSASVCWN